MMGACYPMIYKFQKLLTGGKLGMNAINSKGFKREVKGLIDNIKDRK